jgi:hypothetical protein
MNEEFPIESLITSKKGRQSRASFVIDYEERQKRTLADEARAEKHGFLDI